MSAQQAAFTEVAKNFREGFSSPILDDFTQTMAKAGPMRVYLSCDEFNDDDVYLYSVATGQLLRQIASSSGEVFCARYHGLKVLEGQSWARGARAKTLSLWRPA